MLSSLNVIIAMTLYGLALLFILSLHFVDLRLENAHRTAHRASQLRQLLGAENAFGADEEAL